MGSISELFVVTKMKREILQCYLSLIALCFALS